MTLLCLVAALVAACSLGGETTPDGTDAPPAVAAGGSAATAGLVPIGETVGWAPAPVAVGPDGALVMVALTSEESDGRHEAVISVGSCPDPHCDTPPTMVPVWTESMGPAPDGDERVDMWLIDASIAPDGAVLIVIDVMTSGPGISEIDGLAQYWIVCATAACVDPVVNRVGPLDGDTVTVFAAAMADRDHGAVFYLHRPPISDQSELHVAACGVDRGCVADPATDPLVHTLGDGEGISSNSTATVGAEGQVLFAVGVAPDDPDVAEIILAHCDTPTCDTVTQRRLVPDVEGWFSDMRLVLRPDGSVVLGSSWQVFNHMVLQLTVCSDATCSDPTTREVATWIRDQWDMTADADGTPHLVWADYEKDEAVLGKCTDPRCSTIDTVHTGLVRTEDWLVDLAVAPDHLPVFTFRQGPNGIQLFNCPPETCEPFTE